MKFKPGVKLSLANTSGNRKRITVQPPIALALLVAEGVYRDVVGHGVTVTSVCDGKHSERSLHYAGLAVDLRTTADRISPEKIEKIAKLLRERLTDEFDVVVEGTHIHCEFQPK